MEPSRYSELSPSAFVVFSPDNEGGIFVGELGHNPVVGDEVILSVEKRDARKIFEGNKAVLAKYVQVDFQIPGLHLVPEAGFSIISSSTGEGMVISGYSFIEYDPHEEAA